MEIQGVTFNTIMALAAALIFLMTPMFMRAIYGKRHLAGFSWAFIFLGGFLGISGLYMMLTWPLKQIPKVFCCMVDNMTFGEPAAFYGLLTFIVGLAILRAEDRAERGLRELNVVSTIRPLLYIAAAGGFGMIFFGIAGIHFGMWQPPNIEPIARLYSGTMIEPFLVFAMYVGTGVVAILSPFAFSNKLVSRLFIIGMFLVGALWLTAAISLFYGHVGFFPYSFNSDVPYPVRK